MTVKAGDVVILKSSGDKMTVVGIAEKLGSAWSQFPGNYIVTEWMSEGNIKLGAFDPILLAFADTDPIIGCGS